MWASGRLCGEQCLVGLVSLSGGWNLYSQLGADFREKEGLYCLKWNADGVGCQKCASVGGQHRDSL